MSICEVRERDAGQFYDTAPWTCANPKGMGLAEPARRFLRSPPICHLVTVDNSVAHSTSFGLAARPLR